jgi:hypothetical protein
MKTLLVFLVLTSAAFSQTVLIDTDNAPIATTFESNRSCGGLRGIPTSSEGKVEFSYALRLGLVAGGKYELLLSDVQTATYVPLGMDYRKGTERACEIIKGHRAAIWRSPF